MRKSNRKTSTKRQRSAPAPLLSPRKPVDWWFLFKFNSEEAPGDPELLGKSGIFDAKGIKRPDYDKKGSKFSRHYIYASSANPALQLGKGNNVVGATLTDPLGATFAQVYLADTPPYYVLWNDQFYGDPMKSGNSPWGHSKGMLAWNEDGEGFVLQVSTPSWPGAGNKQHPRKTDGNTLGFVHDDDIEVSQHFFALKLTKDDLMEVLAALDNASVRTDPANRVAVNNGGPAPVQTLVKHLGTRQKGNQCTDHVLSTGVRLISKPSYLRVPPWQLVSAQLGGTSLRVASWWAHPKIYSTTKKNAKPACCGSLHTPGAVDIATTGTWPPASREPGNLGLTGGSGSRYNHAKFGVSTSKGHTFSIFGDMNQQGTLRKGYSRSNQTCNSSQNGRGGLFFVLDDKKLFASLTSLLKGDSAPATPPPKKKK